MCMCLCVCYMCAGTHRYQQKALEPQKLELWTIVSCLPWVLLWLGSSDRAASALKPQAFLQPYMYIFYSGTPRLLPPLINPDNCPFTSVRSTWLASVRERCRPSSCVSGVFHLDWQSPTLLHWLTGFPSSWLSRISLYISAIFSLLIHRSHHLSCFHFRAFVFSLQ